MAGTTAAQNIRRFDETADITIITEEGTPFYSRIRLPEFIAGTLEEKKLIIHKDIWYEENRINIVTNKKVISIDPAARQVLIEEDLCLPYDRLLVATGGRAAILPINGIDRNGVFTLRTIADARKIREYAEKIKTAIIVGGGVLGLETGNALRKLGKKVTFIEFLDRLLPRQLDPEGSVVLMNKLEELGMEFKLGAGTEKIIGAGRVEGVGLRDGTTIKGRMVIISAGMIPEVSLFRELDVPLQKGIPVNDRMETPLADIFAAGDVAEHEQKVCGVWPAAEKQGEVAGVNMAGGSAVYAGTTPAYSVKVAGIDIFSAGDIDSGRLLPSYVHMDKENGVYRKIVIRDNSIAGCILSGDTTAGKDVVTAIREKLPVRDFMKTIEKLDMTMTSAKDKTGR